MAQHGVGIPRRTPSRHGFPRRGRLCRTYGGRDTSSRHRRTTLDDVHHLHQWFAGVRHDTRPPILHHRPRRRRSGPENHVLSLAADFPVWCQLDNWCLSDGGYCLHTTGAEYCGHVRLCFAFYVVLRPG